MGRAITVLLVDDEPLILRALQRFLRRRGFDVEIAGSGEAALDILATKPADVVISDFKMPRMNGGDLLMSVKAAHPTTRRVLLTGYADPRIDLDAEFIPKPFDEDVLLRICLQGRLP